MFITVMFGAGCRELVNPWCSLVTLTAHLRQRGRVPPDATIALLAEDGHLVSLGSDLEEGTSQAPSSGSPLLQERGTYVLVQIINGEGGAPTRYESLLENLDDRCPELAGECHGRALGWGSSIFFQPRQAGLPGPCRGAAPAVGPTPPGQQPEETYWHSYRHSAWPPGPRPSFEVPKAGLPAVQAPLAGARSQVRKRHGYLGGHSHPKVGPFPTRQTCTERGEQAPNLNLHHYTHLPERLNTLYPEAGTLHPTGV
ncbi:PREDICTED: uncharacterized protein C22orf15 homolog isoform X3 [Myotis brandtii]|uniref:uncharacterized protein C22orf15 homolog isoform X3 n=1 Tax=Myotis brandtii TaxID=109478 RepID=UPI000703D06B|nr:PREDICTED: uncharacterized protein C22orf15 homolog isoform X3 [Myotis brandtii]